MSIIGMDETMEEVERYNSLIQALKCLLDDAEEILEYANQDRLRDGWDPFDEEEDYPSLKVARKLLKEIEDA